MSRRHAVAERRSGEYRRSMSAMLRIMLLLAVALLPLTTFAARAGAATDLTSSAVELEQSALPAPGRKAPPVQEHRHCTLWAAESDTCGTLPHDLWLQPPAQRFANAAPHAKLTGPQAPTPPPKM